MEPTATADTRDAILAAAKATAQAHGYNGLSFRELAKAVGIKSASIHYHFPTKGDLGAELARRYTATASEGLARILVEAATPAARLARYTAIFRKALENGNRMCLCAIMAAEHDDLPPAVRAEVGAFADLNVAWLAKVLGPVSRAPQQRALAVFAAVGGAQLAARRRTDVKVFDAIVESYRGNGLIP
jgi:TetR/AcrR family transcriptional repressor of nem operon